MFFQQIETNHDSKLLMKNAGCFGKCCFPKHPAFFYITGVPSNRPLALPDNQALALPDALHERRKDSQLPEVLKAPLHLRVF
jgi:hypothetical protein